MNKRLKSIFLFLFTFTLLFSSGVKTNAETVNGEMEVEVTTDKNEYDTNENINYKVKLKNQHDEDTEDIKINAKIPKGYTIINSQFKVIDNQLLLDIESIKSKEEVEIEFTAQVKEENELEENPDKTENGGGEGKLPQTGERNNLGILGALLLVIGSFFIIKSRGNKKVISIVLATVIAFEISGNFIMIVKAEENILKSSGSKSVKVKEKSYDINFDVNYKIKEKEIVEPTNNPPVVNAGEDREVYLSDTINLEGSATDDGLVNSELTIIWKQLNGPGEAIIEENTSLNPKISFIKPGDYEFELSAFDGKLTSKDTIIIKVIYNLVGKIYTSKEDFEGGNLINVKAEDEGFIQIDDETRPFNFIWVAVSSKGTVVKINTDTGEVVGEYYTSPSGQPKNPSNGILNNYSDSIGNLMNFVYDSNDRPISATDGEGNVYTYTYDDLGNCTSKSVNRRGVNGIEEIVERY